MKKRIAFKTLGCRLNQYETNAVMSDFANAGYQIVDMHEPADAYVVNTCTVTNQSDHKSRQIISQTSRKNEDAILVVTGCMANHHKDKLLNDPRITYTLENDRKGSIFQLIDSHFKGEILDPETLKRDRFHFHPAEHTQRTRSLIKIQDGCDNFCTFCIVPHVRGRAESRPWNDIEKNIREVLDFGYREIVLTGVNIGRYQHENINFEDLVEKILDIPGDFRVRISSIEPEGFGDKLFDLFHHPKLMPHLHMCLQSGSEKILLKMRRQYTVDQFVDMVNKVKSRIPDFNFTTDVIVGFPGETKEDFQVSFDVAENIGFSHIHTFKYSIRKGTRAERLPDHVPEKIKNERSAIIRKLSEKHKHRYRQSLIGKTQRVLVEKIDQNGLASGYGEQYTPIVFQADKKTQPKEFREVIIMGIEEGKDPNLIAKTK
jgi:threonylcarbamoyladenosine tRNA methylthiotransferase MtaB